MTIRGLGLAAIVAGALCGAVVAPAHAADTTVNTRYTTSDGVELQTTLTGEAPLAARPVLVEFSPYGRGSATLDPGPGYNRLLVQIRGTGDSDGSFDVLGPRTQADVAETLSWACKQSWSDGRLALHGFSASAITVYNSLHQPLPCVKAATLKSGTFELYRDLLTPGGVSNVVPGAVVLAGIGGLALSQSLDRDPATYLDVVKGELQAGLSVLAHPTLDSWWAERGFRGDVNHLPILMVNGFSDVESRGAFEAYQALKGDGAHLLVIGGHDAPPAGTDGGLQEQRDWLNRFVRGIPTGVARRPKVQLWLSDGSRQAYVKGAFVRRDSRDWPLPGTKWKAFFLDPARSGSARSLNDGTLSKAVPATPADQPYPSVVSVPTQTDVPNAAILDSAGLSALTDGFPALGDMSLAEPLGLSYTTAPLAKDVLAAGPAALRVRLATTTPGTPIWAVLSDVGPDGVPHALGVGRLSTDFPGVDAARSRRSPRGSIVQPYGDFSAKQPATAGRSRSYQVEFWPLGNRFKAGHRIRLHLVGTSAASLPGVPAINTVTAGGPGASRLLIPSVPAKDPVRRKPAAGKRGR